MKSRISIDIDDFENKPIIKIEYIPSDDLRDKTVKKFLEGFGGDGDEAYFRYTDNAPGSSVTIANISPVSGYNTRMKKDLDIFYGMIIAYTNSINYNGSSISICCSGREMAVTSGLNTSNYFDRESFYYAPSNEQYNMMKRSVDELIEIMSPISSSTEV